MSSNNRRPHKVIRGFMMLRRHLGYYSSDFMEYLCTLTGRIPSHTIRLFLYRRVFGITIGSGSTIHAGCRMYAPGGISIGQHTVIGDHCFLDGRMGLNIGNNVNIAGETSIYTLEHDPDSPEFSAKGAPVTLGDYVFTGSRSMILPGVTVGEGAGIAAGAVVTRDVQAYTIVGGVPAKFIKERNRNLQYTLKFSKLFQ